MLKEVRLRNWKSFAAATLHIDPLTLLIGANAGGKSNALDALRFLQRVASGVELFQALNGDANQPPLRGGMEWVCRKPESEFELGVVCGGAKENVDYQYDLRARVNGVKVEVVSEELRRLKYGRRGSAPVEKELFRAGLDREGAPNLSAFVPTGGKGRKRRVDLQRGQSALVQLQALGQDGELAEGLQAVAGDLRRLFVFDPIPSHMRDYVPLGERLNADGSNLAGVLAALAPAHRGEVEGLLSKHLAALPEREIRRVWSETVGKFNTDAMLYCEEGWPGGAGHVVDARGMSDGTLRYLAIAAALLTREPGGLLVVEEVDNGLHPSRARLLLEMLRELGGLRGVDVLATTHNPALLDAAGPRMAPFIVVAHRDPATGASLLTELDSLAELPKLLAGGSLGRLSTDGQIEAALGAGGGHG